MDLKIFKIKTEYKETINNDWYQENAQYMIISIIIAQGLCAMRDKSVKDRWGHI